MVTADEVLLEDLLRLVAASGREADVGRDPALVRARWRMASVVLLGVDAVRAVAAAALPRRPGILLVGGPALPPSIWSEAVEVGVERVLSLPDADGALVDLLIEAGETALRPGRSIAVVGGCGGAGASVLAAGLAVTAARAGHRVLAVDADPWGGGTDLLYGAEQDPGLRWPDLREASGRIAAAALHRALPAAHGVAVLSHARGAPVDPGREALLAVVRSGCRAGDVVVTDLARTLGAGAAAVAAEADLVLLVVPSRVRACAAASRTALEIGRAIGVARVVVRAERGSELAPDAVADAVGLPLAGVLRSEPALAAALERGEPPAGRRRGPLTVLCRTLLSEPRSPGRRRAA